MGILPAAARAITWSSPPQFRSRTLDRRRLTGEFCSLAAGLRQARLVGLGCTRNSEGNGAWNVARSCQVENQQRRAALLLVLLPAMPAVAKDSAAEDAAALPVEEELSLIASRGEVYKTKYYSYYVPRGWEPVEMGSPDQTVPSIESKFVAPDGLQSVAVTTVQASTMKPTFFQIKDISEWGGPQEVYRLVSRGERLLSISSATIPGEERDTGTIRGVVKTPDTTIYRYEMLNSNERRISMALAARAGLVFKAQCAAPLQLWETDSSVAASLKGIADSFRLL